MIKPAVLDAMVAAGCTAEQIAAAVKADQAACDAERAAQGPRAIAPDLRDFVLRRDGFLCTYCGVSGVDLHCDHVVPYSRGGATSAENLVASCKPCNSSKKDRTPEEWRPSCQ